MKRALRQTRQLEEVNRKKRRDDRMCAICLEPCSSACEQCVNGHKFHIKCIQRAFPNRYGAKCPVCRQAMYQPPSLRPRPPKLDGWHPESMHFTTDDEMEQMQGNFADGFMSFIERMGGGVLLLQPDAIATSYAVPISSLPRYQTNVALLWLGRVQRGRLWIENDIVWFHHADQDVTNDPSARNPTLSWGESSETVRDFEANGQPVLAEARSGDPVIYLGDGRAEPPANYRRSADNSCALM